jgi:hypothetical protein
VANALELLRGDVTCMIFAQSDLVNVCQFQFKEQEEPQE